MGKRKSENGPDDQNGKLQKRDRTGSEDEESDTDMLDVEFEWFDPQPQDFEGVKLLLKQLLGNDAIDFHLGALADLILGQPLLGSTVKVDGNESDPYAFLQILNMHEHKDIAVIQQLRKYLITKSSTSPKLSQLPSLLAQDSSSKVGLILTERLMNIPPQVIPPMYKMLQEEMQWAVDEGESYSFSHYLIISKKYIEIESSLDQEGSQQNKKSKKDKTSADQEAFYFHPEDEVLERHALGYGSYEYSKRDEDGAADSRRAFQDAGIRPVGSLILLDSAKLGEAVEAVQTFVSS